MSLPLVAVVGRPNVGKSTLVNRLSQRRDSIVHESAGVTRDRSYHETDWSGKPFILIDTGGIETKNTKDSFSSRIREQALLAVEEADAIIFVVDAVCGVTSEDEEVARILRKSKKPVFLVANKLDEPLQKKEMWDFYSLGLGEPLAISAAHGHGTGDLLDALVATFPSHVKNSGKDLGADTLEPGDDISATHLKVAPIKVALIGRPNAGKSSLLNRLLNKNRSIVSDVAGTTRDSILAVLEPETDDSSDEISPAGSSGAVSAQGDTEPKASEQSSTEPGAAGLPRSDTAPTLAAKSKPGAATSSQGSARPIQLIDTAGLRKASRVTEDIEYYSVVRVKRAIDEADICLLVVDSSIGLTEQDQKIAGEAISKGCALGIILNKWDLLDEEVKREQVMQSLAQRLPFASWAPLLRISALSGRACHKIVPLILELAKSHERRISTARVNEVVQEIRLSGHTVVEKSKRLKLKYATQVATEPPTFAFFCNFPELVSDNYRRYIERLLRDRFDFVGTPLRIHFRAKV